MVQATTELVAEWITSESEWLEIITDLINGDYTQEALRQDFEESMEDHALSWLGKDEEVDDELSLLQTD